MRRVGGEIEVKALTEGVIWKAKWLPPQTVILRLRNFDIEFLVGLSDAYDPLDPNGNITIKWDVISWTADGYLYIDFCLASNIIVCVRCNMDFDSLYLMAVTWNVTCTYSQFLAGKNPTCCVSLSSFYNDTIVPCPTCTCGCQNNVTHPGSCVNPSSPYLESVVAGSTSNNPYSPLVQCTNHMCPIRVHWHVKLNYMSYWRIKLTVLNFNYKMNYSQWNLVAQHPNFDNVTQVFSFNYKSLTPYGDAINDTAMLWGEKFYNDILMEAGPLGNAQSEILFQKDASTFTFEKGWAFPQRIYFNGDNCVMPLPDDYPFLPNSSSRPDISFLTLILTLLLSLVFCYAHV
ncbi:hypothetical protein RHGRI_023105 [Rhododendron griersonianum]|uniref:COBRA C-terminal domain-containing protein n=1 Tax=Rhododendron griersonianum TaxID=479676 RepID=A0AAV6J207_9ERIC|nr:hypothetical protein RHGRI_023105 [Rhododendron griersonianum]